MSRNSSGAYSQPSGTTAVSGATIDPTAFNTLISDIGNELSNSLDRGGRGAMTAALNLGGFKGYNAAEPSASSDLATKNYVDTDATKLKVANNLSDLASAATARSNLGLGTAAVANTGTGNGNVVTVDANGDANDGKGRVRSIPPRTISGSDTAVLTDVGKYIKCNSGAAPTVPANVFSDGDAYSLVNLSGGAITITQGTSLTLTFAGLTSTGNRTLAANGVATILFTGATTALISGAGLS